MYNSRTVEGLCGMLWIQMGIVKFYHLIFSGHFTGNICNKTGLLKEIKWHETFPGLLIAVCNSTTVHSTCW